MDLLGPNMPPAILLGADEVIEQDARARKLKLSRSQLGTWTKDSFGSRTAVRPAESHGRCTFNCGRSQRRRYGRKELALIPTAVVFGFGRLHGKGLGFSRVVPIPIEDFGHWFCTATSRFA